MVRSFSAKVGKGVGDTVGFGVGDFVGLVDGEKVGLSGDTVGVLVGPVVGLSDGDKEGDLVGETDVSVGEIVEVRDGAREGLVVGTLACLHCAELPADATPFSRQQTDTAPAPVLIVTVVSVGSIKLVPTKNPFCCARILFDGDSP